MLKKFTMIIDEMLHRKIKSVSATLGMSMVDYIVSAIMSDLKKRGLE